MAWTPKRQVIDLTPVIDNLFGYFQQNESDAFTWANKGIAGTPAMKKYYKSAIGRVFTVFPYFALLRQDLRETAEDMIDAQFTLRFVGVISGGDADALVATARIYEMAYRSMLTDISSAQLTAGMNIQVQAELLLLESAVDELAGNRPLNSIYFQEFPIRATFRMQGSYFHN